MTPKSIFSRENLLAWCIVPFDASKRTPAERAAMLQRLGIGALAYDWRQEHIPTFDEELTCVNLNGMTRGGPKILNLGEGAEDVPILRMIRDSGYAGPLGILDHRPEMDAAEALRGNLDGLPGLLQEIGETEAAATYG